MKGNPDVTLNGMLMGTASPFSLVCFRQQNHPYDHLQDLTRTKNDGKLKIRIDDARIHI
jgi:hypothetical protein